MASVKSTSRSFTKEKIIGILKSYKEFKFKALQLEFEINHYRPAITDDDIIDTMTFSYNFAEPVQFSNIADRTSKIAVSYFEKANRLNFKHKQDLINELEEVQFEMKRLEYYIGILDDKYSCLLRSLYIEDLTLSETCTKLKIPVTTANRLRMKAVEKLAEMYGRLVSKK